MKSLSVRAKLILAIASLTFSVLLVSGIGIFQTLNLRDSMRNIAFSQMPRSVMLQQLNTLTADYRILEGVHILASTDAQLSAAEKKMAEIGAKFTDLTNQYLKLSPPPIALQNLAIIQQKWSAYGVSHEKVATLSRAQKNDEATALFVGGHEALFQDLAHTVDTEANRVSKDGEHSALKSEEQVSMALAVAIILGLAALIIAGIVILYVMRGVTSPLQAMAGAMEGLSRRDYALTIPGVGRQDEIGQMAGALNVFREGLIDAERLAKEQAAEQEAKARRQEKIEAYIASFDRSTAQALGAMSGAASQLQATAQVMTDTANATNDQSAAVAAASEQATANVQTVAAASEELSGSITEISRQVQESSAISTRAKADAGRTVAQVRSLNDAAQRIGDVVKLISDVAAQTNLLALNATIEAARAGEAGKGFAVVAAEVKNLAQQTSKATEEISTQVASVQGETGKVVGSIEEIGQTIERMNEIAGAVAAAVEEQGAATQEIARNVQQAAIGTQEVSGKIVDVSAGASQTGAAATQVLGAADELARQGSFLRQEVETFLHNIRTA